MDGVLVIDKPSGMTSHDVVAAVRRLLGERRIGHTGTLDPMATGVLPLAIGRATRLVSLLTASQKEYLAEVRFGFTTDSYDVTGEETGRTGLVPAPATLDHALAQLSGTYLQAPPPVSAKKIAGRRAYDLARAGTPVQPASVPVTVTLDLLGFEEGVASLRVCSSPGFYVRSLAHALGELAGTGACLQALRRTRSGDFALASAVGLGSLQNSRGVGPAALLPLERLLPGVPAVVLTDDGEQRVSHGRDVGSPHVQNGWDPGWQEAGVPAHARLFSSRGELLALAVPAALPGFLHPSAVLR